MKIQAALGSNARNKHPSSVSVSASNTQIGQAVMDSCKEYLEHYLNLDDGSSLVQSIYSQNLRDSALFSAKSARISYLLGKLMLLDAQTRKGIVRNQVIEYGAVAEAILLDLIQSVGKNNLPIGLRPTRDKRNRSINWNADGLLARRRRNSIEMLHWFDFKWLIGQAKNLNVIDSRLEGRVNWLRKSRNLVHPVIPTASRYSNDINSSKTSRDIVVELKDSALN
ncbi:hypothetical protein BBFGKLBO_03069 [Synechococcus sp. CBW1107]|uniref:hypothetical protein n=1 Tax=Synechococcus sp. CBW1107 TaxID=2789857 RepID=UPI002AD4E863|nr:hypothetical protein [Synechococcus sp. CBW1107]CAK6701297.1 hypothetical protein BBFGKLBO_03069 [Synechococcus sp. CBW1107]